MASDRKAIEKAICFLVDAIRTSGNNPKPVILHSVQVGLSLLESDCPIETVVAGILHDVVEDSDTSIDDIAHMFGDRVATIVEANTNDPTLGRRARDKDTLTRCIDSGKAAIQVKAADILENWSYFTSGVESLDPLFLEKTRMFLEATSRTMGKCPIFERLNERYRKHVGNYG